MALPVDRKVGDLERVLMRQRQALTRLGTDGGFDLDPGTAE
ncbi:hypothetical protein [Methylobacterium soli]|nr:hypothetical protein [Methylobacterium soli]